MATYRVDEGAPRLHGAERVGCRPGTELIHTLAATGERPLAFTAVGLPAGVALDPTTGIVRGTAPAGEGTLSVEVTVTNPVGSVTRSVEFVFGDRLALTPPMGWNSWNVYGPEVDAEIVKRVADGLVSSGMRDLGYSYVNIDDHWHAERRGPDGEPRADTTKFPDGIAAVADYVHDRGLKLGIYSDAAEKTCGGCYGGYLHEEIDARAYADWGVDLLKYDYCHAPRDQRTAIARYSAMADALAACDRSILFSVCEWGMRRPWEWAPAVGASMWRTTPDIFDSFSWSFWGVRGIARRNLALAEHAAPGQWNDPDMLVIGNRGKGRVASSLPVTKSRRIPLRGLSDVQAATHMSLWVMMAAPLLASSDPVEMLAIDRRMLMNPEILAINQDPLGHQARVVSRHRGVWVLRKPLDHARQAVSFSNMRGWRARRSLRLSSIGLAGETEVTDAWAMASLGRLDTIDVSLDPDETRVFVLGPSER